MAIAEQHSARNIVADTIEDLALERLHPWELNPRTHIDEAELEDLVASVRRLGVLEPLLVRPHPAIRGDFVIVAGHRRFAAAQRAERSTVPVRVLAGLQDDEVLKISLIENLQRVDLDPLDEAEGYRRLAELGMKQGAIAEAVHRSQPAIANTMRLLDLPDDVRERIRKRELTASHGVALAKFKAFPKVASAAAEVAVRNRLSSHETEHILERHSYALVQTGAIAILYQYGAREFDQAICEKCPFDARRKAGNDYSRQDICLKPEHYRELAEQAKRAQKERVEAAIAQAVEAGDTSTVKLESIPYDQYAELYAGNIPPGCTEACACRAKAVGHGGRLVTICTKPGRLRSLRAQESGRINKWRIAQRDEAIAYAERSVESAGMGRREWVAILSALLRAGDWNGRLSEHLIAAAKRRGYGLGISSTGRLGADQLEALAEQMTEVTLSQVCLEGILRWEISLNYRPENEQWSEPTLARWYLNLPLARDDRTQAGVGPMLDQPDPEADAALQRQIDRIEGRACYLCDCLDDPDGDGEYIGECVDEGCCPEGCREKGVVMVTERGGVCATCSAENEICRVCGCTNDDGCDEGCEWAGPGLCSECVGREQPAPAPVEGVA